MRRLGIQDRTYDQLARGLLRGELLMCPIQPTERGAPLVPPDDIAITFVLLHRNDKTNP